MAPKRQRGESSRAAAAYDHRRFISEEASLRYHASLVNKTLIPERGLGLGASTLSLHHMIWDRNWGAFTQQPEPAVIIIVKEFYANADRASRVSRVRGKSVSFSKAAINAYYQLEDKPDEDGYTEFKRLGVNDEQVIRGLCQPDAAWVIRDGHPRHFAHKYLSKYGKAWYYFICAKLLPTTHVSDVTRARAVLLYCLVHGRSIDVGQVISGSIRSAIEGGSSAGLPHPSLISGLCQEAGVVWDDNEPLLMPKVVIDDRHIDHYSQWDGAPADPRGAGFLLDVQSPEANLGSPPHEQAEPSLASLAVDVRQLQRESRRQTRHIDYVAQQVNSMVHFNADFMQTLAQMFERSGLNSGPNPLLFPQPPVAPAYPPDSPAADDA